MASCVTYSNAPPVAHLSLDPGPRPHPPRIRLLVRSQLLTPGNLPSFQSTQGRSSTAPTLPNLHSHGNRRHISPVPAVHWLLRPRMVGGPEHSRGHAHGKARVCPTCP